MAKTTTILSQDFINHYSISSFFNAEKQGGQKRVYFIIKDGIKQVLKIAPDFQDERLIREMEIYKKYEGYPGIPKIISFEEYHGEAIIFEEFIEGDTLSDIVKSYANDCIKTRGLLKSLIEIMDPLWQNSVVHRDIKPDNIMIKNTGEIILLDFGIARDLSVSSITSPGFQPGTYIWSAPEQLQGHKDQISYRTDLFAIGVLGYFLYHQKMPFGNNHDEVKMKYESADENFEIGSSCDFNLFLKDALRFSPGYRPRLIKDYLKNL